MEERRNIVEGGKGSGYFSPSHRGRKGQVGGSLPSTIDGQYAPIETLNQFTSLYNEWTRTVTDDERKAIEDYTGDGYSVVNALLRGQDVSFQTARAEKLSQSLQGLIDRAPESKETVVLYRGLWYVGELRMRPGVSYSQYKEQGALVSGATFRDAGFLSTSMTPEYARKKGALARITIPKGTKMAPIGVLGQNPHEREWLLPAGSRFRIRGVSHAVDGRQQLELELLP